MNLVVCCRDGLTIQRGRTGILLFAKLGASGVIHCARVRGRCRCRRRSEYRREVPRPDQSVAIQPSDSGNGGIGIYAGFKKPRPRRVCDFLQFDALEPGQQILSDIFGLACALLDRSLLRLLPSSPFILRGDSETRDDDRDAREGQHQKEQEQLPESMRIHVVV